MLHILPIMLTQNSLKSYKYKEPQHLYNYNLYIFFLFYWQVMSTLVSGKSCSFHCVDLLDKAAISAVFSQYPELKAVIHFAALKAVGESFKAGLSNLSHNEMMD